MKKIFAALVALVLVSLYVPAARANEGYLSLTGEGIECEGVSLWQGSSFEVNGRCAGLVYPYATQQERYVIWGKTDERGELVRISEVERGYFEGIIQNDFTDVYITAESEALPRKPSQDQVVSGKVTAFAFAGGEAKPVVTPSPLPTQQPATGGITVQNGAATAAGRATVASAIGRILRSLLVIIAVVVVLVIVTSLIFRRRGSVSA